MTTGTKYRSATAQMAAGLKALGDAVFDGGLRRARGAAARVGRDAAKASDLFTTRTGNLVAGIKVRNTRRGTKLVSTAPHSFLVERGHGGPRPAPPHPFLTTAVQSTTDQQLAAAAKALAQALRQAHKPASPVRR